MRIVQPFSVYSETTSQLLVSQWILVGKYMGSLKVHNIVTFILLTFIIKVRWSRLWIGITETEFLSLYLASLFLKTSYRVNGGAVIVILKSVGIFKLHSSVQYIELFKIQLE